MVEADKLQFVILGLLEFEDREDAEGDRGCSQLA